MAPAHITVGLFQKPRTKNGLQCMFSVDFCTTLHVIGHVMQCVGEVIIDVALSVATQNRHIILVYQYWDLTGYTYQR